MLCRDVVGEDDGSYECQISMSKKMSQFVFLRVLGKGSLQKKKLRNFGHVAKFLDPPPREVWTQKVWTLRMGSDPPPPLP